MPTITSPLNSKKVEANEKELVQPKIVKAAVGLNLNPQDFMVKQRPKTVTVVPKDAKNLLKTSPFAPVTNPIVSNKPAPNSPTELVSKKLPSGFVPPEKKATPKIRNKSKIPKQKKLKIPKESRAPPKTPKEPSVKTQPDAVQNETTADIPVKTVVVDSEQKADLEKSLMDLKIKKASITKMSLDFDMKELTGEITEKELEEKKNKLSSIEKNITEQIKEIKELLGR